MLQRYRCRRRPVGRPDIARPLRLPLELDSRLIALHIRHTTRYTFHRPVLFGPHRLMLRPRESRDLRILSNEIEISPTANLTWAHDVSGNAVATATFAESADHLVIESRTALELSAAAWPVFDIAASALSFPFRYADEEWTDLGALAMQQFPDPSGQLQAWAQGFVRGPSTDTLSLLKDMSAGVSQGIDYRSRDEEGTQTPTETLDLRQGSCRDFAVLFAEAVRSLGFGARLVSGYLYNPDASLTGSADAGSTHAWAEVFVPGAGWITFDPTNRSMGGFNLIPVALVRDLRQASPIAGSFIGGQDAFRELAVEVSVTSTEST